MIKKILLLLLLICSVVHSQVVSGYVYDEAENKPLEGAYIYLDGTTFSVSSDAKGYFKLTVPQKYNVALVISFIGFETLRIEDPFSYEKPIKVLLREDATVLDEVVITNKSPFTRKQMLTVFRKEFLGRSRDGKSCRIENEDDILLHYDMDENALKARVLKPLRITNKRLEYKILFDLKAFEVNYSALTLDDFNLLRSFYAGTTSFTDISKQGSADKKRKEAYAGSVTHLMRTIRNDDWKSQKFTLYMDKIPTDPHAIFEMADTLKYKRVRLNEETIAMLKPKNRPVLRTKAESESKYSRIDFHVLRDMDTQKQSVINFNREEFYIDENGLFYPIDAFFFRGYMGSLKAGDLLPADYVYEP